MARRTRSFGDIERKSSQLKILEQEGLPQAKHVETIDVALPLLSGVEVVKIVGCVLGWSGFTALADELLGLFSRGLRLTSGWKDNTSPMPTMRSKKPLKSLMSAVLVGYRWEISYSMAPHCSCLWRGSLPMSWVSVMVDFRSATWPMEVYVVITLETLRQKLRRAGRWSTGTGGGLTSSWK